MVSLTSDHFLSLISDTFPGLIAYLDQDGRYRFMNRNYQACYDLDIEASIGKTVTEVLGEKIYLERQDKINRALKGEKIKFTVDIIHRELGPRILEQIYQPDIDKNGQVNGFLAMAYDVTEQRRMEKSAQDVEARFRSLTEVMPQLVWLSDKDGRFLFINNNWPRFTGTSFEDNLGHGWLNSVHPEDRLSTESTWQEALKTGLVFEKEYRLRMSDGSYRWHMARGIPIRNDQHAIERWVGTTTDIEVQKNAENIAVEERKKIYSLFMQAPAVIIVFKGPDHIVELFNRASLAYSGRDITGKKVREAMPELEGQGIFEVLDEVYQTGQGQTLKSKLIKTFTAEGEPSEVFYDIFYEPIKDDNGLTIGIMNMAIDVTEQVKALIKAEESETLFRTYAESMPQIAFIADKEGNLTYLNQRWYDYIGENTKTESIYHPDDSKIVTDHWAHSIATGEVFDVECRLLRKDGVYRWHLSRAIALKDSSGNITQWVGTTTDIHDQKEIESIQARLLQVLDSSSDFIGMADIDQSVIYLNQAGRKMVGIDPDQDLSDIKIESFFFKDDLPFLQNVILPTTLNEEKWVGDYRFRDLKTEAERWVHLHSFTTHDEKTGEFTGFAAVSRDLTEIKQNERRLEEALIARDQFLSIASHELKTPLTSLKLQSQLTLRSLELGKAIPIEKQITMAHQTNELVGRLTRLIDDMLDVSRIKTGKLQLDKGEHELGDIVREVVLRMSLLFEAAKVRLPSIDAPEKLIGEWDRFRLEQVIGNLLTNAIRYGRGKPIEIKIIKNEGKALLTVTDHGYGIAEEDLTRIFGRFERAINSSEVSGLGLGLFISKEIIETLQGRIWVESKLGEGSTFYIELPLKNNGV